jgi:hypothetical protein
MSDHQIKVKNVTNKMMVKLKETNLDCIIWNEYRKKNDIVNLLIQKRSQELYNNREVHLEH